jgi:hypothetical protein
MIFLRSNTAVIIAVGPFYDKTDGVTIETALTITNERITLVAETDAGSAPTLILDNITGATAATSNDLNYIASGDNGMMQLELAAADVNRVGRMKLSITDAANHVPVFHELFVLPAAIYDWLTGVIVPLPANTTQWLGSAVAAVTTAGVPEVDVTHWGGGAVAAVSVTGVPKVDLSHVAGSATSVSALASGVATLLADWNNGGRLDLILDIIAADTTTDIPALIAALQALVDTEVAAILAAVDTEVAAILALLDDARGEPAQGAPPVNPDAMTKLDWIYKLLRNRKTNDGTTTKFFADDGVTVDHKQTTSESAGTVSKGEIVSGP